MATIDRREAILLRLEEILAALPEAPLLYVFRNRGAIPVEQRPCGVLLDGDEITVLSGARAGRGTMHGFDTIALMPQIALLLKLRSEPESAERGPELSIYRSAVYKNIMLDSELYEILTTNGKIEYLGSQTDMKADMSVQGELLMNFAFHYPLSTGEL